MKREENKPKKTNDQLSDWDGERFGSITAMKSIAIITVTMRNDVQFINSIREVNGILKWQTNQNIFLFTLSVTFATYSHHVSLMIGKQFGFATTLPKSLWLEFLIFCSLYDYIS